MCFDLDRLWYITVIFCFITFITCSGLVLITSSTLFLCQKPVCISFDKIVYWKPLQYISQVTCSASYSAMHWPVWNHIANFVVVVSSIQVVCLRVWCYHHCLFIRFFNLSLSFCFHNFITGNAACTYSEVHFHILCHAGPNLCTSLAEIWAVQG